MNASLFPRIAILLSIVFLALSAPTQPNLRAAPRAVGPNQLAPTVTGTIVYNTNQPLADTFVLATPIVDGFPDTNNSQFTYTDEFGTFTFDALTAGEYTLDVEPYCLGDALPLHNYTFTVPATSAPVSLGQIPLPVPNKHIQGSLTLAGTPDPVADALIEAYNHTTGQYVCATTDSTGSYNMGVDGGSWDVSVQQQVGADWMFTQPPTVVTFADDTSNETIVADLQVEPVDATLVGRVLGPDGNPLPLPSGIPASTPINYWASIDIWNEDTGSYNYVFINTDGTFEMPVVAGRYTLDVWLEQSSYPDLSGPPTQIVEVGTELVDLGDLRVSARDKRIAGVVRDDQSQGIESAYVQAYDTEGRYTSQQTDGNGNYELQVSAGIWTVNAYPPDGSTLISNNASAVISTTADTTTSLDFTFQSSSGTIDGVLKDTNGLTVTDAYAWAYARTNDPDNWLIVAEEPVVDGEFHLNVVGQNLLVGVFLDPNSGYSLVGEVSPATLASRMAAHQDLSTAQMAHLEQSAYEQHVTIAPGSTNPLATTQVTVARNDASITGHLIAPQSTSTPLTGVTGVVVAWPATTNASSQWTDIVSETGAYTLTLSEGDWYLGYYLDGETYDSTSTPDLVHVTSGQTLKRNLFTTPLDGIIDGTVQDVDGKPLAGTYIWIRGPDFEQYSLTGDNGTFSVPVPLQYNQQPARYTVGTEFNCDQNGICLLNAEPQTIMATARNAVGKLGMSPQSITLKAKRKGPAINIKGSVKGKDGKPRAGALVNFWPSPGQQASDDTNSKGEYSMNVTFPEGTSSAYYWLEAGYRGNYSYEPFETRSGTINLPSATSLAAQPTQIEVDLPEAKLGDALTLPKAGSYTFKASEGWTYTFTDATQLQIPPNAVPLTPTAEVRVTVEATPRLPQTSLYRQATYYGYTIMLYDAVTGRRITEPLKADAQLTLRYDDEVLSESHTSESQLRPANYTTNIWQSSTKYVLNTTANKVTVQTRSLGAWALVRPQQDASSGTVWLPLVVRR
jgi:protocatechuate 3,4-dioxygenase beta subunit